MRKDFSLLKKRYIVTLAIAILALVALLVPIFAASAHSAAPLKHSVNHAHSWQFNGASQDSGTCGADWALDTYHRAFRVDDRHPALVLETFTKGAFTTMAGVSPGACNKPASVAPGNGDVLKSGIKGLFAGYAYIAIKGGKFNPKARFSWSMCDLAIQSGQGCVTAFILAVYGAGATVDTSGKSTYAFDYFTMHNGSWHNASKDAGGNQGDITAF